MTTPSQLAKEYAATHGFTITPDGRRYVVSRDVGSIANVGGYPAALKAMKEFWQFLCDNEPAQGVIAPDGIVGQQVEWTRADSEAADAAIDAGVDFSAIPALPDPFAPLQECAAYDSGCQYGAHGMNGEMQCQYCGAPLLDELVSETRKVLPWINDELVTMIACTHEAVIANVEAQIKALTPNIAQTTKDEAIKKLRGSGPVDGGKFWRELAKVDDGEADRYYDNAPLHVRERIRKLAKSMNPGGRWYVTFNGAFVTHAGHATRADALKQVRRGFNSEQPFYTNWRTGRVTIIYME